MYTDKYWSSYAFTDTTILPDLLNMNVRRSQLPESCPTWNASGNIAGSYGPVIAYPASRLQAQCRAATVDQQSNVYTCEEDPVTQQLVISNFWSTTAVNESTNVPLSHVLVDVLVLDDMNQTVSIGESLRGLHIQHVQLVCHCNDMHQRCRKSIMELADDQLHAFCTAKAASTTGACRQAQQCRSFASSLEPDLLLSHHLVVAIVNTVRVR